MSRNSLVVATRNAVNEFSMKRRGVGSALCRDSEGITLGFSARYDGLERLRDCVGRRVLNELLAVLNSLPSESDADDSSALMELVSCAKRRSCSPCWMRGMWL